MKKQNIKIKTDCKKFGIEVKFLPNVRLSDNELDAVLMILQSKTKDMHIEVNRCLSK